MKKIRIIAAISAVITAVAVYIYLTGLNKPAEEQRFPVVVAVAGITEGTEIKAEMVTTKMLTADAIVDRAATSVEEVVGRISSTNVSTGEQLLVSRFFKSGETNNSLAIAVEKGKRAFTVAVDSVTGVAGLIRPRDNVDVLLVINVAVEEPDTNSQEQDQNSQQQDQNSQQQDQNSQQTATQNKTYSSILLQNINVLATGQIIKPGDDANAATTVDTVTLSLTPEQAVKLNLAVSEGKIRLVLRSPVDSDETDVSPIDVSILTQ